MNGEYLCTIVLRTKIIFNSSLSEWLLIIFAIFQQHTTTIHDKCIGTVSMGLTIIIIIWPVKLNHLPLINGPIKNQHAKKLFSQKKQGNIRRNEKLIFHNDKKYRI